MADLFLPTTNYPATEYQVTLDGQSYTIYTRWNETDEAWYMDIIGLTNSVLYRGIKIVGGVNLIGPFAILEMGSMYMIDLEEKYLDPDFATFGDRFRIMYRERAA